MILFMKHTVKGYGPVLPLAVSPHNFDLQKQSDMRS